MTHIRLVSQAPVCAQTQTISWDVIVEFVALAATVITAFMGFIGEVVVAVEEFKGGLSGTT